MTIQPQVVEDASKSPIQETSGPLSADVRNSMPLMETTTLFFTTAASQSPQLIQEPTVQSLESLETTQKILTTGSIQDMDPSGDSIITSSGRAQENKFETTVAQIQSTQPPSADGHDQTTNSMKITESSQDIKPEDESSQISTTSAPDSIQTQGNPEMTSTSPGTTKMSQKESSAEVIDSIEETAPPVKATKAPPQAKPKPDAGKTALTSPTTLKPETKKESIASCLGMYRFLILLPLLLIMI